MSVMKANKKWLTLTGVILEYCVSIELVKCKTKKIKRSYISVYCTVSVRVPLGHYRGGVVFESYSDFLFEECNSVTRCSDVIFTQWWTLYSCIKCLYNKPYCEYILSLSLPSRNKVKRTAAVRNTPKATGGNRSISQLFAPSRGDCG